MKYSEMLKNLFYAHPETKIKLGLDRIRALLERLGNPQNSFKYVHVAGTNGKGTVTRTVGKVLSAHGLKVGTYFSPHLETFRERMRIDDALIQEEDAVAIFEEVMAEAEKMAADPEMNPTFFEIVTAMAFLYFGKNGVDAVVSEVGMGGRFDATNVVENPVCTVVTVVDYDHMNVLGSTLSQIAFEKAGIIKDGVPLVTGETKPEPLKVILSKAREHGCEISAMNEGFRYTVGKMELGKNAFEFEGKNWKFPVETRMNGMNAVINISIALRTLEVLEEKGVFKMDYETLYKTVFTLPGEGRIEWLPSDVTLILDVGHNAPAMKMLRENLEIYFPSRKINGVVGILDDKDYEKMIDTIAPVFDRMYITSPRSERARDSFGIYSRAVRKHDNVGFIKDVRDATGVCMDMSKRDGAVTVVTGSFYTVGIARTFLTGGEAEI